MIVNGDLVAVNKEAIIQSCKVYHSSFDIHIALIHWPHSTWKRLAREKKVTVPQLKSEFVKMIADGKKAIPVGEPCEGFSYQDGCPGHDLNESMKSEQ